MPRRYVVGVDGSAPSDAALSWAAQRAVREGSALVVAHVDETEGGIMGLDFRREIERRGRGLVDSTLDSLAAQFPALDVTWVLLSGSPAWALADFVEPGDTIVIGTHKTGYLNGRVLGSRSVQVAIAAECDVAVIPVVDLRFRTGVVAGVDRESTAASLGRIGAREAEARGDELIIMHAGKPDSRESGARQREQLPITAAIEAARDEVPSLIIRSRVSMRPPAEALLDASRGKALLVLGPGSLDPGRSPIGSVMHETLLNANAPVLIARSVAGGAR